MITNQLKENIIQGRLFYVIRSFLQVGFRFQYQLINLVWLSIDFFSFSWSQPRPKINFKKLKASFSSSSRWGLVCAVVEKYHEMYFIYNYSHFWYSFSNQPVLFVQLENINKLWNNNRTVHVNERNQTNKQTKKSHVTSKLTTRSIVRFSPQAIHWYH